MFSFTELKTKIFHNEKKELRLCNYYFREFWQLDSLSKYERYKKYQETKNKKNK